MKTSLLITSALFLVALLLGWKVGPAPLTATPETPSALAPTKSAAATLRRADANSPESLMRSIHNAPTEHARMEAALSLAMNLPLSQAGPWLDDGLFDRREGFALSLFTNALRKRWESEDPRGYLVHQLNLGHSPYGKSEELMAQEPDLVVETIRGMKSPAKKLTALRNLAEYHPERALAELLELGPLPYQEENYTLQQLLEHLTDKALPALQTNLSELPPAQQSEARRMIYARRLKDELATTLPDLYLEPDGFDILTGTRENIEHLAENRALLLEQLSEMPESWRSLLVNKHRSLLVRDVEPNEIFNTDWQALGLNPSQANTIKSETLLLALRRNEANEEILDKWATLPERNRRELLRDLRSSGWEKICSEERSSLALLDRLSESERELLQKETESQNVKKLVMIQNASELSESLMTLDRETFEKRPVLLAINIGLTRINDEQKAEFKADYEAMKGPERHRMTAYLASLQNEENIDLRAQALNEMLQSPETMALRGWETDADVAQTASEVAVQLLEKSATQATDWATSLPEGEARTFAMRNLAKNWQNHDPDAVKAWVDSLPPADRKLVQP